ncbi:hypothetical protein [Lentzea sp. E54]|uniref:ATP dependent DNA ligase n=1 Tax=Lentzea xerophila TaxID=3435883 RepID=UPI003DA45838
MPQEHYELLNMPYPGLPMVGQGNRAGRIRSLLLGAHDSQGGLIYVGHVGTGFSQTVLADLQRELETLGRPARMQRQVAHAKPLPGEGFASWSRVAKGSRKAMVTGRSCIRTSFRNRVESPGDTSPRRVESGRGP